MVLTIGLYNHNGMVGSQILKHLLPTAQNGGVKLIVLHRPTSDVSKLPVGSFLEKRMVDLEKPDRALNERSVQGINVMISCAANQDRKGKPELVEALASNKDLITFIPSDFGVVWTRYLDRFPQVGFVKNKVALDDRAKELGMKLTNFRSGSITPWMLTMDHGDFGIDVRGNRMIQYKDTMSQPLPMSSPSFIGQQVARIITSSSSDPHQLANKTFSLLEASPTGDEIARVLEKIHGKPPTIVKVGQAECDVKLDKGFSDALAVGLWNKWTEGDWEYDGEIIRGTKGFEELARECL